MRLRQSGLFGQSAFDENVTRVAMVLAAGFGTRLRPLSDELPKPLMPVGDRPVVGHVAQSLLAAGYEAMVANVHHLPACWSEGQLSSLPLPTTLSYEAAILGTAGGVAHAAGLLPSGALLVHGGDMLTDVDLPALERAHADAWASLAVVGGLPIGQGTVGVGAGGAIVRLRHGRHGEELSGADFVGVQILSARARAALPREGCLVGDVYMPALERGERVVAQAVAKSFCDIGTAESYLRANLAWLAERDAHVGEGARVGAGVTLAGAVVGAGATVAGRGGVRRAVIWPGAHAVAPLTDCVVTPRTTLRVSLGK